MLCPQCNTTHIIPNLQRWGSNNNNVVPNNQFTYSKGKNWNEWSLCIFKV